MTDNIDPFASREAAKYVNPIPSREYILEHILSKNKLLNLKQLIEGLNLVDADSKEALRRRTIAMVRDGQLEVFAKKYWPKEQCRLIVGRAKIEKNKDACLITKDVNFVVTLPKHAKKRIFDGSEISVIIPIIAGVTAIEGKLVEVLEQSKLVVSGRFLKQEQDVNYVIPYSKEIDQEIFIPPNDDLGAQAGDIVLVEVLLQEKLQRSKYIEPIGKILEILGSESAAGIEIISAIRNFGLPEKWPKAVTKEIKEFDSKTIPAAAKRYRVDLRELPLVTIDGEDARDFDDAVFCEPKKGGGWKLYVAIADVSYYVKPETALDKEAKKRGNSVYFPNKVLPMLPEVLSNGLCSLKPEVERLCMVCEMNISEDGKITKYQFYEGVMRSFARLTYKKVAAILAGDQILRVKYDFLVEDLENLHDLYQALYKNREIRGAIEFDTIENKIIFNKKGKISRIEPVKRNVAHKIIEECMLCANVATAKFLQKHKIPALYRNHEPPLPEKVQDVKGFLKEVGLSLFKGKKSIPTPGDYSKLLKKIKTRDDMHVIQVVLLRSLSQALYQVDNNGHFGLAFDAYTHFTSPIRRYPDLIVHRKIREIIKNKWHPSDKKIKERSKNLAKIAEHCSITERRADDATREVILLLKCKYMRQYLGKTFEGIISGVTSFGLFVELTDIYVDGLVHVTALPDDYYIFNPTHHLLLGERTGREYSLGMKVKVQVARVNVDERKIDLVLVSKLKKAKKKKKRKN